MPIIEMAGGGPYEFDGSPIEYNLILWRGADYRLWFRIRGAATEEYPNGEPLNRSEGLGWQAHAAFREKVTGPPGSAQSAPTVLPIAWAAGTEVEFYVVWPRALTRDLPKRGGWELDITDSLGEQRPYYAGKVTPKGEWSVPEEP